jgi:hypothetical protein
MIDQPTFAQAETNSHHPPATPEQPRLALTWELDSMTGKPVARWVPTSAEVTPVRELAAAA